MSSRGAEGMLLGGRYLRFRGTEKTVSTRGFVALRSGRRRLGLVCGGEIQSRGRTRDKRGSCAHIVRIQEEKKAEGARNQDSEYRERRRWLLLVLKLRTRMRKRVRTKKRMRTVLLVTLDGPADTPGRLGPREEQLVWH